MGKVALKIENVSKQYRLGLVGTGTLSDDLKRWWYLLRGKEDPFLKIGQVNNREETDGDYVMALNNINVEIKKGEVLGIIGKNGAGKSTLLKLLSQVTSPSTGSIKVRGRIAALLEVGTGFHPELTGRENIFLNGAILGMTKKEINSKLQEIIDFSGVAKYIDTPVKRYSSGMMVRLGFAVAAHLEPEILVVDEVLAVGDAEFQKKCIGKMKDVAGEGRTVLFVSHNMVSIKNLCTRGIFLKEGKVGFDGGIQDTIDFYMKSDAVEGAKGVIPDDYKRRNTGEIKIKEISILDKEDNVIDELLYKANIKLKIKLTCFKNVNNALIDVKIVSMEGIVITHSINTWNKEEAYNIEIGEHSYIANLENYMHPGNYSLTVGVHYSSGETIDYLENIYDFQVLKMGEAGMPDYPAQLVHGWVGVDSKWEKTL
jgi:lipopolysaccharide transport system ATP-binding protein